MVRSSIAVGLLISTALVGCAAKPEVAVRSVGAVPTEGGDKLALARASLALGNVGLALQQFRQALRVQPTSTDALSGIALCYDAMGRDDLSRRYFQEALALAPADKDLLRAFAAALARQGATAEAQAVVAEIALRTKAPAAQWVIEPSPAPPMPAATSSPAHEQPSAEAGRHRAMPAEGKARLERLSLGEIALVTTGTALWKTIGSARVLAPRPGPGQALNGQTPAVRLLNAARRQGLAARHAQQLKSDGWIRLQIGNASRVRSASLILYPSGRGSEARRLAAELRISALQVARRRNILVLLGRDLG